MIFKAIAGVAVGLLAACGQSEPVQPPEPPPVAEQPASPAANDQFAYAINYECEGGGTLEAVFGAAGSQDALVRADGGVPITLQPVPDRQNMIDYKGADATLAGDGQTLTWTSGGATKNCMSKSRALPAPTVAGVVRTLGEADAGALVDLKVGEKISVALVGVPTAGYVWAASSPPAFIKATEGPGGATSTDQYLPGFTGGSHWEVVVIEGVSAGEGEITLAQRRPWETTAEPDAKTFKFKLKVS